MTADSVQHDRKRPTILMIGVIVLAVLTLGYIYSYRTSNLQLLEKHTILNRQIKGCTGRQKECTVNLETCISTNRDERRSKKHLETVLLGEKANYEKLQRFVDSTKTKLAQTFKFYVDVGGIIGANVDGDDVIPENASSITEAVKQLKEAHNEYMKLQNNYVTLSKDKQSCMDESKALENAKTELESRNKVLESSTAMMELKLKELKLKEMNMEKSSTVTEASEQDKDIPTQDKTKKKPETSKQTTSSKIGKEVTEEEVTLVDSTEKDLQTKGDNETN